MVTDFASSRIAVRAESMATFPPPMTQTFSPRTTGVSKSGNRYAFIHRPGELGGVLTEVLDGEFDKDKEAK